MNDEKQHSTIGIATIRSHSGMMLPGSSLPQQQAVHIHIQSADGKTVVDGYVGHIQFMTALMGGPASPILLRRYASGDLKSEEEPQAESVSTLMQNMLADNDADVNNAVEVVQELVDAISNGHLKPNKQNLLDLKRATDAIRLHVTRNRDYIADKVHRAMEHKASDIAMGLVNLAQSLGLPGAQDQAPQLTGYRHAMIESESSNDARGFSMMQAAPKASSYHPLESIDINIPEVPLEKMTSDDLAKEIHKRLKTLEMDPVKNKKTRGDVWLFSSGATVAKGGVNISYIDYQGKAFLDIEQAREYLAGLRSGYVGRHYEFFHKHKAQ